MEIHHQEAAHHMVISVDLWRKCDLKTSLSFWEMK